MKAIRRCYFLPILAILLMSGTAINADQLNGVRFAEQVIVGDHQLNLVGTSLLTWAVFFDVYAGAFYLPDQQPGSRWTEDVPKQLELSYFRDFKAEDFSVTSDKLLRETLTPEKYQALAQRLGDFYQLFRDIKKGDRYSLVYDPQLGAQGGTELRLNGKSLGYVTGHDFAIAYFGIWIGPEPISTSFRDHLLDG